MVVYNFEDYFTSDKYRELLDELIEFLEDTQVRLMEYAMNLKSARSWQNQGTHTGEETELEIDPEELANIEDPKIQRLMELYFETETTLEDLRD